MEFNVYVTYTFNLKETLLSDCDGFTTGGRGANIIHVGLVVHHMARCIIVSNPYITNQIIILRNERAVQISIWNGNILNGIITCLLYTSDAADE